VQLNTPEALLRKALSVDPAHTPSLIKLAEILIHDKKLESANQCLRKIIDIGMGSETVFFFLAKISVQQQKWEEAEKYIRESLRLDPKNYDSLTLALLIYQKIGDHNQVIQKLETIVSFFPTDAKFFYKLSKTLKTEDLYHRKVFFMEEAYSLENNNSEYIKELLYLYADSYKYPFLRLSDMDDVYQKGTSICTVIENVEISIEVIESCLLFLFYSEQYKKIIQWHKNLSVFSSSCMTAKSNLILAKTYSMLNDNSNSLRVFTEILSSNKDHLINIHYYQELVYGSINRIYNCRKLINSINLKLKETQTEIKVHLRMNELLEAKVLLHDFKIYSSLLVEFRSMLKKFKSS